MCVSRVRARRLLAEVVFCLPLQPGWNDIVGRWILHLADIKVSRKLKRKKKTLATSRHLFKKLSSSKTTKSDDVVSRGQVH